MTKHRGSLRELEYLGLLRESVRGVAAVSTDRIGAVEIAPKVFLPRLTLANRKLRRLKAAKARRA